MSATNTPGRTDAGAEITLRIGQRVRLSNHAGNRVTGQVRGLVIEEDVLMVHVVLDAPIVIPARGDGDREISIWHQHVPAHEVLPFDDRDDVIATLRSALQAMLAYHDDVAKAADQRLLDAGYAAIAKATGSAS